MEINNLRGHLALKGGKEVFRDITTK